MNANDLTLSPTNTAIVLVDAQLFFWERCFSADPRLEERIAQLLLLSSLLEIPLLATFEAPLKRKGQLTERWEEAFPAHGKRILKNSYNCSGELEVRTALQGVNAGNVGVAGSETDVCVLLSVLGLLQLGYRVHLIQDCVFSSSPNCDAALTRMIQAGAVPTTYKTFAYEICGSVDGAPWLQESADRHHPVPRGFVDPDDITLDHA